MKRKHQFREWLFRLRYPEGRTEAYVDSHLPKGWWKYPSFSMELDLPFPYVWLAYWLISWKWDDYQLPLWERRIEEWFGISFLPD